MAWCAYCNVSLKCAVCFVYSSIQTSFLFCSAFSGRGFIWDNKGEKRMYTQQTEANIKHYAHTVRQAKNTVMLEIRMAFHANRALAVQVTGCYCTQN